MNLHSISQNQRALNTIYSESGYLPSSINIEIWKLVFSWWWVPLLPKDFLPGPPAIFTAAQQHTQAFCLPPLLEGCTGSPRLFWDCTWLELKNQLKNWHKLHKLLMDKTDPTCWWNPDKRPHQPPPDEQARSAEPFLLLCSYSVNGCGMASSQVASYNLHPAAHLLQGLIHAAARQAKEAGRHAERPPGTEAARVQIPITYARLVRSVWEVLQGHPLNKWAWPAWNWPLNPGTSHLLVSRCKEGLSLLAAVAGKTLKERRAGRVVESQRRLKHSWHESGKKANTASQSTASSFLQEWYLALNSISTTRFCSFPRARCI